MRDLAALARDMAKARQDMQKFIERAPRIMGTVAKKIVKQNFLMSGYDSGNGFTKWDKRKPATDAAYDRGRTKNSKTGKMSKYRKGKNSTYKGSVYSSAKPLLRQTLSLYDSIDYIAGRRTVFIGVVHNIVPYAKSHNEGLNHQPKRKYMPTRAEGPNPKMINGVRKVFDIETAKIMKTFKR